MQMQQWLVYIAMVALHVVSYPVIGVIVYLMHRKAEKRRTSALHALIQQTEANLAAANARTAEAEATIAVKQREINLLNEQFTTCEALCFGASPELVQERYWTTTAKHIVDLHKKNRQLEAFSRGVTYVRNTRGLN